MQGRSSIDCFKEIVGRNMDVGGDSGKGSEGSKEHCRVSYHFRK